MAKEKIIDAKSEAAPSSQRIVDLWFGCAPTMVLAAAVELDLFTALAAGAMTAADAAKATGASARGTAMCWHSRW